VSGPTGPKATTSSRSANIAKRKMLFVGLNRTSIDVSLDSGLEVFFRRSPHMLPFLRSVTDSTPRGVSQDICSRYVTVVSRQRGPLLLLPKKRLPRLAWRRVQCETASATKAPAPSAMTQPVSA
jgi:hypothetical protein